MPNNNPQCVAGDGIHDDTAAIQALLDSGASVVHLPAPPVSYLISKTLIIHSGQTLNVDRNAIIRLADNAHAHMITNSSHSGDDSGITITGGIWDGNNTKQTCEYHETGICEVPYDPERYLGVVMQFCGVRNLRISNLTIKDPETFAIQIGNITRFTIEDITFDYNMAKANMDGVHLHGNCHQGRIADIKGTTNDDMVALNADDGSMYEMSRGPITDIQIDGLHADNGYTAIRMLSAGHPINRVHVTGIFGSFRYYVTSFGNFDVHPGEPSEISEITIDGVYCSKPLNALNNPLPCDEAARHTFPFFWVESNTKVLDLHLTNIHRRELLENAPPTFYISENSSVENLCLSNISIINEASTPLEFMVNKGEILNMQKTNVYINK